MPLLPPRNRARVEILKDMQEFLYTDAYSSNTPSNLFVQPKTKWDFTYILNSMCVIPNSLTIPFTLYLETTHKKSHFSFS